VIFFQEGRNASQFAGLHMFDKYSIIEESRTRVVYNWLQCFSQESIREEFEESGFTIEATYGDVAGAAFDPDASVFAVVARPS
jgi:hypothetical protein